MRTYWHRGRVRSNIEIQLAALLIVFLCTLPAQELSPRQPYDIDDAYLIYSLLIPHEEAYEIGKGTLIIQEDTVSHSLEQAYFDAKSASKFKDAISG